MNRSPFQDEILTRNAPLALPKSPLFIGSLAKALRVLDAFGGNKTRLTATEIGRLSGLGASAAQRFIFTLTALGLLAKDERTKQYRLSVRLLDFTYLFLRSYPVSTIGFAHLEQLAHSTGEYMSLSVLDRADVAYIVRVSGVERREHPGLVGGRLPSFSASNGRVLLAALPPAEAREIVETADRRPLTPKSLTKTAAIMAKIDEARTNGYCVVDEETELGVLSVAVAVYDRSRRPLCAISTPLAKRKWSPAEAVKKLVPEMNRTAQALGRALAGAEI